MKENELIVSLKENDQSAFLNLIEKYKDQVFRVSMGFLHSIEDSEEIVQDVFLEVFKTIHTFRQEAKLSTWLYRITVNKSLNVLRKRNRRALIKNIGSIVSDDQAELNIPDRQQKHPLEIMELKESANELYEAINSLPNNQKTAFTLNKYDDLSYKEIEGIMKLSLSAVESLIHRAKKNLQKKLLKTYLQKE